MTNIQFWPNSRSYAACASASAAGSFCVSIIKIVATNWPTKPQRTVRFASALPHISPMTSVDKNVIA